MASAESSAEFSAGPSTDTARTLPASLECDALTRLARMHLGVATALITVSDGLRQRLLSVSGVLPDMLPPDLFLQSLNEQKPLDTVVVIPDTRADTRFAVDQPDSAVTWPRFFAAGALTDVDGHHLGALYLMDDADGTFRIFDEAQRAFLHELATLAAQSLMRSRDAAALRDRVMQLEAGQVLMTQALTGSGTGVWDRNVVTGEIHYSPAWKAILGYEPHEIGNRIEDAYLRLHPDDLEHVQATMQAHFDNRTDSYAVEHRIRCKDGSYKWICSRGRVISRDADGRAQRMVGTTTDITALREMAAQLHELATIDHLTQLPNRRHFMIQSELELVKVRRGERRGTAVLVLDLDHFKALNDRWGHALGDRALSHFAEILCAGMRADDIVGRLGGEEFAVVLPDTHTEDAIAFAQGVQRRAADAPLMHDGHRVALEVSIGIDMMRATDVGAYQAIDRGDKALYLAKKHGRNRIEIYYD